MAQFIKQSKFRHVFCDQPRTEAQFTNFRLSTVTGEQNYIKANSKYFAVALSVSLLLAKIFKIYALVNVVFVSFGH